MVYISLYISKKRVNLFIYMRQGECVEYLNTSSNGLTLKLLCYVISFALFIVQDSHVYNMYIIYNVDM